MDKTRRDVGINYSEWLSNPNVEKLLGEKFEISTLGGLYLTTPGTLEQNFISFPVFMYLVKANGGKARLVRIFPSGGLALKLELSLHGQKDHGAYITYGSIDELDTGGDPLELLYRLAEREGPNALSFITPFITKDGVWKNN